MPKRILKAGGLLNGAVIALLLYLIATVILPTRVFIEILNGIFLGLVVAVTVVFFPLFRRAVVQRNFDRVAQLTIGIILTWASLILSRSASAIGRITGNTEAIAQSPIIPVAAYLAILGAILHVTAPGMLDDRLKYNKGLLAGAILAGAAFACLTIYLQRTGAVPWLS